ncbi:MAG: LuxR C-terminal-related transcriptional regulator [Propionibacteriaceae bacterium]|nr:LuxR C-terminal-related transcriptional regulator [Propionibacteriaceae bacterium]
MASGANTASAEKTIDQLVHDLTKGLSVLLIGLPQSGRTHIVRSVANELNLLGANTIMLRGNRMLVDRPLTALSLAGVNIDETHQGQGGSIITRASLSLETLLDRPKSVLLIDDADGLDKVSVGVISDLRLKKAVPTLLVGTFGTSREELIQELVSASQPGVSFELNGMSLEDISQMTGAILDGKVSSGTSAKIAALSGGLPGLVQAIVKIGLRNGRLIQRNDVWIAHGDLWDRALEFQLLPFMRGLHRDEQKSLTQLAWAENLSQAEANALVGEELVHKLALNNLLHIDQITQESRVRVFPQALAHYLRDDPDSFESFTDRYKMVTSGQGHWPSDLTGPDAASLAEQIRTRWLDEIARQWVIWDEDKVPRTAVPLLSALFSGVLDIEKTEVVAAKTSPGDDLGLFTEFVFHTTLYRAIWENNLEAAMSELAAHRSNHPKMSARVRAFESHLIMICDRVPEAAMLEVGPDEDDARAADLLHTIKAESLLAQGFVNDARKQLALVDPHYMPVRNLKQALDGLVEVLSGDPEAGIELATKCLKNALTTLDVHAISGYAYVAALGMCILGRLNELESVVEVVYRTTDANLFQNSFRTGLLMLGSYAADWEGRREYAQSLAFQAKPIGVGTGPFPGMMAQQTVLYDASGSGTEIWDEVDNLLDRGYITSAVFLGMAAIETDHHTTRATNLINQASRTQSELLRALVNYIAAVANGDLANFKNVVAKLRKHSGPIDTTRATITWALMLRERGDNEGWLKQTEAAWRESGQISRSVAGLFSRLIETVDMTSREIEVASYVTRGLSSTEIATKIGVATRTIEAHLHSIYRKTGVNSREELRQISRTWLFL